MGVIAARFQPTSSSELAEFSELELAEFPELELELMRSAYAVRLLKELDIVEDRGLLIK